MYVILPGNGTGASLGSLIGSVLMRSYDIDGVFYFMAAKKHWPTFLKRFHIKDPVYVLKYRPTKILRYSNKIGMLEIIY
jgi:hypothetical protein